ncbi:uncharacterized protein LOC108601375 [Drosophila busckii]|uniref:uncharacterized protein LOC108601375 n=1 Tax=Drosophila busckii TaxID=30019 RepID=UPI0014331162|nr:uncharacterized protein LOC108601375 [Drosophila busckii]
MSQMTQLCGSVSDYRKLPYEIPKTSILDGFNKFYDDVVIGNFGNCSDLPKFENGFTNPMPQGLYTLETCVANGNGLPEVLPQGFYKIHIEFVGEVNWKLIFYFKITPKLLA